jgi:hypothetical protein
MTSELISRRTALVGSMGTVVAGSLTLVGCGGGGGGGGNGNTQVRAINLTTDLPSVDIYAGDTKQFSAQATDTLSAYQGIEAKEYTLKVNKAGDAANLLTGTYSLGKDQNYTAVVWGRETALRLSTLPENEDTNNITTSTATRIRMFNATTDSGTVDVYLTLPEAVLGETAATQAGVTAGQLTSFRELNAQTWRLRVTGVGDPNDVRLDIPSVVLDAKSYYTLIITAGASGVLVNATLVKQQSTANTLKNTKSRVRIVAGADNGGVVNVTAAGVTLVGGLRSPSVGPYQLVNAGAVPLVVRVGGTVVVSPTLTFVPGTDYTLMVYGTTAAPQLRQFVDDNRLPALNTRTKVRLIHGAAGVDPATLSIDFLAVASDISVGGASAYANVASGTSVRIDVTSATAATALYTAETVNLQGASVYTVFVLGGNATTTGVIRKER